MGPEGGGGGRGGLGGGRGGLGGGLGGRRCCCCCGTSGGSKAQLAGTEPRLLLPGPAESQAPVRWPESGANLPSRQPRVVKAGLNKG